MFKNFDKIGKKGITLTETIMVIAILVILALTAIPALYRFQDKASLGSSVSELASALRLAKTRTVSSQEDSQWGVYLDAASSPQQFVLFKGANYASREIAFDENSRISSEIELFNINLAGASQEVVFAKVVGNTSQYGDVSLRIKSNPADQQTIYIDKSGRISLSTAVVDDTDRVKDSRRVHFTYDRAIDISEVSGEDIILSFAGGTVVTIPIFTNMSGGQIFWSDTVDVAGNPEVITVHTLRLNNPDTLFCAHRGRDNNDIALDIDISGDLATTPDLIRYFADGGTQKGNSLDVSEPIWR